MSQTKRERIKTAIKLFGFQRCDNCHKAKPIAFFTIYNMWDVANWCRPCANAKLGDDYYISVWRSMEYFLEYVIKVLEGEL